MNKKEIRDRIEGFLIKECIKSNYYHYRQYEGVLFLLCEDFKKDTVYLYDYLKPDDCGLLPSNIMIIVDNILKTINEEDEYNAVGVYISDKYNKIITME